MKNLMMSNKRIREGKDEVERARERERSHYHVFNTSVKCGSNRCVHVIKWSNALYNNYRIVCKSYHYFVDTHAMEQNAANNNKGIKVRKG